MIDSVDEIGRQQHDQRHAHPHRGSQPVRPSQHQPQRGPPKKKQGSSLRLSIKRSERLFHSSLFNDDSRKANANPFLWFQIREQNRFDMMSAGPQSHLLAGIVVERPPVRTTAHALSRLSLRIYVLNIILLSYYWGSTILYAALYGRRRRAARTATTQPVRRTLAERNTSPESSRSPPAGHWW